MSSENALTLIVNGLTLALSLSFLIILFWYDARREITHFFAAFLSLVILWNLGSLLAQSLALIGPLSATVLIPLFILELGFTGSSVALYALIAAQVKLFTRRFRLLVLLALALLVIYRIVLYASGAPAPFAVDETGSLRMQERGPLLLFYLVFNGASLYLIWRFQRKIRVRLLMLGLVLFIIGQSIGFLNPQLQTFALTTMLCSASALLIGLGVIQQEIINPLSDRKSAVEALRQVITSTANQSDIDPILSELARQSAALLEADGAAIFLRDEGQLTLRTTYELPTEHELPTRPLSHGVAGAVATSGQIIQLDDYARDWRGQSDFSFARTFFGSVVCAPLVAGGDPIGAMLVVASRQGKLFDREDTYLLQLLAAQAAVAITQSRLFSEQTQLTEQIVQSRNQLETIVASTESPVIAVDRSFRLLIANPAAQALFPAGSPPAHDAVIADLLPASAFPANLRRAFREIRRAHALTYEATVGERIFLCHVASLGQQRMEGWVAVLNDITQLKELDRLKSEMVRMTSHDLKNPLQAAMANLDLLREDVYDSAGADVQHSIDVVDRQLQRMNRIIRGILDLERVREGTLTLSPCEPAQIVRDAIADLNEYAREHGISLTATASDDLPTVYCDQEQFKRALVNLIENAIKFTAADGRVEVSATQQGPEILFTVSDTGVGMSAEVQERIFDRFFRGKQRGVEHVSGSGLGLSLVKAVATNHSGRVWAESQEGKGTRFFITLPCAPVIS
jgi:signal transduction histidine kinase